MTDTCPVCGKGERQTFVEGSFIGTSTVSHLDCVRQQTLTFESCNRARQTCEEENSRLIRQHIADGLHKERAEQAEAENAQYREQLIHAVESCDKAEAEVEQLKCMLDECAKDGCVPTKLYGGLVTAKFVLGGTMRLVRLTAKDGEDTRVLHVNPAHVILAGEALTVGDEGDVVAAEGLCVVRLIDVEEPLPIVGTPAQIAALIEGEGF